jgi:hypothetical protein
VLAPEPYCVKLNMASLARRESSYQDTASAVSKQVMKDLAPFSRRRSA